MKKFWACLAVLFFMIIPSIAKETVTIIIPEQKIEIVIGEEFQIIGSVEEAEVELALLRAVDESEIFIANQERFGDEKKHWIEDENTFDELSKIYGFGWGDIPEAVSLAEVNKYVTGDTILWNKAKQEFVVGQKAKDIYFPEEPVVGDMKAVWSNLVELSWVKDVGFNTQFNFNFQYRTEAEQRKTLDEGTKYGIKILPVLHQILIRENDLPRAVALVEKWKDHPAWGGSIMLDEPQLNRISVARQKVFYDTIKEADPDHNHYTAFLPTKMKPEYYDPNTFDVAILNYYPFRTYGDWRAFIVEHLDDWIDTTGMYDVLPNMQAFEGRDEWKNPLDVEEDPLERQFVYWLERNMVKYGYSIYAEENGAGSGSLGIRQLLGMEEEVTEFNKARR